MLLTAKQLTLELCSILDPANTTAAVESYQEMQQRFFAGDWQPTELDGGRLCEAVARCMYQLDSGTVTQSQLPSEICEKIEDLKNQHSHNLGHAERTHICKAKAWSTSSAQHAGLSISRRYIRRTTWTQC